MPLEYSWNGIALEGGLPNPGTPSTSSNTFAFLERQGIKRLRVLLDPRVVMPVGATTIPAGVQANLVAVADSARTTIAGQPTLTCDIEWALLGCTEPTSATASRRPTLGWLRNFWEKVDDLLGSHAATWGYSLLSMPTVGELTAANGDTDPSMVTWAARSWSASEDPKLNTAPWLEAVTRGTVTHLRSSGCTKIVVCPMVHATSIVHVGGPWVDDSGVWYESVLPVLGADGLTASKPYDQYAALAAATSTEYRDSWTESAYWSTGAVTPSVIDALELNAPARLPFVTGSETVPSLPVTNLTAVALNGGARVSWTAPTDFGTEPFAYYRIESDGVEWRTELTAAEIQLPNEVGAVVDVTVVTGRADSETGADLFSTIISVAVTPSAGAPQPLGPWLDPFTGSPPGGDGGEFPLPQQPMFEAFPQDRNFRPANWLKTPDQVEDGL